MPKNYLLLALLTSTTALTGCRKDDELATVTYPSYAEASSPRVLATAPNSTVLYNGGFGSALAPDPNDPTVFYLLTDRGPNAAGVAANSIVFGKADFTPQIGKFRLKDGQLTLEQTILLKNAVGQPLTGLPNPAGQGSTGETALDLSGQPLGTSVDGIDSEGLVLAPDGTFWISDEYGPHIAHFDATGKQLERINPFGSGQGGRTLPLVLARRRPNRGMEGLCLTPDGKTLVGLMQSPLYNPSSAAVSGSVVLRVVAFELATGATKQYAYLLDNASLTGCSEITAVTNTTFLALERDGLYGGNAAAPAAFKKVFKFDLAGATDISDASNTAAGKLYNSLTMEQLKTPAGLAAAGVVPVTKTLVLDLLTAASPIYPHDKAEGLALVGNDMLAISNDDDFGVLDNGNNGFAPKILPATGKVDVNRIYFVKLPTPLR
jgi:hypothetical protein